MALPGREGRDGGEWCHGTERDGLFKKCYSNYKHNNNYHGSTAAMAGGTDTRYGAAGYWSQAGVTAGWAHTCYTYYNPNAQPLAEVKNARAFQHTKLAQYRAGWFTNQR
ncbi:Bacteriocin (Lactococcin_972) [Streptoalloteichus tenebrarius]|uniref:Bacteriocin (Lactococcin_972) n=1 Tax=Streptoalloteichus tenebrarius (strain ATCC 17920 / DSM 40477 / JCM 4838 / CBS 697.72 / NBRC 16177 / NCIMB 11028 / NRRL B-12390 / A12253. 1 / ISP 5477) TaxID=1933 RepID=A0ABT1I0Q8_STRSD|nr:Bacteriocin (Lactococcin_972) [Streptoalloteichus tenebrarius]BFF03714.1 hypothetical protein GCM10020241_53890 [Streptoalloteichus tenebrarius]